MFKQWGIPLNNLKDDVFKGDSRSSYTTIEGYEVRDNVNKTDLIRPIRNVFEDTQHTNDFVEKTFHYIGNPTSAIIKKSLINGFSFGDTDIYGDTVINPGFGDTYRYYVRLGPGIAYHNNNIVVSRPQTHIAERQIAKILQLDDWYNESVSINYFYNTDLFQAKITKKDINGVPRNYYFVGKEQRGDSSKWGDSRVGYPTSLHLFQAMYQGDTLIFRSYFRTSLGDSIHRIICEPIYKFLPTAGDTIFWKIRADGTVYGDTKFPQTDELKLWATKIQVSNRHPSIVNRGDSRRFTQNYNDFSQHIFLNVPLAFGRLTNGDTSTETITSPWSDSRMLPYQFVLNKDAFIVILRQSSGIGQNAIIGWKEGYVPLLNNQRSNKFWMNNDLIVWRGGTGDTLGKSWISVCEMSGDSWIFFGNKVFKGKITAADTINANTTSNLLMTSSTINLGAINSVLFFRGDSLIGTSTFSLLPTSSIINLGLTNSRLAFRGDTLTGTSTFSLLPTSSIINLGTNNSALLFKGDTITGTTTFSLLPSSTIINFGYPNALLNFRGDSLTGTSTFSLLPTSSIINFGYPNALLNFRGDSLIGTSTFSLLPTSSIINLGLTNSRLAFRGDTLTGTSTFSLLPTSSIINLGATNSNLAFKGDTLTGTSTFSLLPTSSIINLGATNSNLAFKGDTLTGTSTFSLLPTSTTLTVGASTGYLWYRGDSWLSKQTAALLFPTTTTLNIGNQNKISGQKIYIGGDSIKIGGDTSTTIFSLASIRIAGTTKLPGSFYAGTTNPSSATRLNYDGYLYATVFQSTSSKEFKSNIKSFKKNALDILNNTKIVTFNYKEDPEKKNNVGFIAEDADETISGKEHNLFDINNTIGILIKATQELDKKIETLKKENKGLKAENKKMVRRIESLEKQYSKLNKPE